MAKIFYPQKSILVNASSPHPPNTQYKISIGSEDWGTSGFANVVKVQMVYDGKVEGRRSPSFPIGTDDLKKVLEAIEEIQK